MIKKAFTLIEVLVVVAIIALLVAILLPSLQKARESAYRVSCQANMHSIGQAMTMYATDTKQTYYMFNNRYNFSTNEYYGYKTVNGKYVDDGSETIGADSVVAMAVDFRNKPTADSLTANKKYIRNWDVLICPGTRNKVTKASDLNNNADDRTSGPGDGNYGHSYEFWNGFQKYDYARQGGCSNGKSYSGSGADTDGNGFPDCLKRPKLVSARATWIILMIDGDDPNLNIDDRNNWPDSPLDNHGKYGWNSLLADMHVGWFTQSTTYNLLDRSDMSTASVPAEYIPSNGGKPPTP